MASINTPPDPQAAWNEAYERLLHFFGSFALRDHAHVSRLALRIVDEARARYEKDPVGDPAALAMELAQREIRDWFATNLDVTGASAARVFANGYLILLLSRLPQAAPASFMASPLPYDLRQSLHQTLLVAGPDLNISSMTPRRIDYGPMLDLARQTWHRLDAKSIVVALLFWTGIYFALDWAITTYL
jgi:hypothetical protein